MRRITVTIDYDGSELFIESKRCLARLCFESMRNVLGARIDHVDVANVTVVDEGHTQVCMGDQTKEPEPQGTHVVTGYVREIIQHHNSDDPQPTEVDFVSEGRSFPPILISDDAEVDRIVKLIGMPCRLIMEYSKPPRIERA